MKLAHLLARLFAGLTVLFGLAAAASVIGAADQGTRALSAYFAKDFTDVAYQQKAYERVAAAWIRGTANPPIGAKSVVITTLSRDGRVAAAALGMKSGVAAWDDAALAAVRKASPFAPFPASYPGPTTEVHFHFEWKAQPLKH